MKIILGIIPLIISASIVRFVYNKKFYLISSIIFFVLTCVIMVLFKPGEELKMFYTIINVYLLFSSVDKLKKDKT